MLYDWTIPELIGLGIYASILLPKIHDVLQTKHADLFLPLTDSVDELFLLMRRYRVLLVGDMALRYCDSTTDKWPCTVWEFAVPHSSYHAFGFQLLLLLEGRLHSRHKSDTGAEGYDEISIIDLGNRSCKLYRCASEDASIFIASCWSTLEMNALSPDGFCMAYPKSTWLAFGIVRSITPLPRVASEHTATFNTRGYTMKTLDVIREEWQPDAGKCRMYGYCETACRFLGDAHCVTIWFRSPAPPPSSISTWTLPRGQHSACTRETRYRVLRMDVHGTDYVVYGEPGGPIELYHLPFAGRPVQYLQPDTMW